MSGFISIAVEKSLADQLARAQAEAVDLTPAMAKASEEMLADTRRRFLAQVAPGGVPWKKSRRAIEEGGATLQREGFLLRSLDRRSGGNFAEVGVKPGAPQESYAAVHQFGSNKTVSVKAHQRKVEQAFGQRLVKAVIAEVAAHSRVMRMPARPYLGFDPDTIENIREILTDHLRSAFDQAARA